MNDILYSRGGEKEIKKMTNEMPKKYLTWIQRELKKGYPIEDLEWIADFYYQNFSKFEEKDIFKWDGKQLEDYTKEEGMYSRYNYL